MQLLHHFVRPMEKQASFGRYLNVIPKKIRDLVGLDVVQRRESKGTLMMNIEKFAARGI